MTAGFAENAVTPQWLASYDEFAAHVRDAIADEPTIRRGGSFSKMGAVLLPSTEAGQGFVDIEQSSKQSHDDGVDAMSGFDADGRRLVIQSKLTLDAKKDLDSILSYFYQFENPRDDDEGALFGKSSLLGNRTLSRYLILTLSRPNQVIKNYEKSNLGTRDFYDQIMEEGRLSVVDGEDLWEAARSEFSRAYSSPEHFTLVSPKGWLAEGEVRIGVVPARELVTLYEKHGDGLFFENIRSFLGLDRNADRETVNRRILATAEGQLSKSGPSD